MPKSSKGGFYAVKTGRVPGVYGTWDLCKEQIDKFPSARHKKFDTYAQAYEFAFPGQQAPSTEGAGPSTSTASNAPTHRKKPYDKRKAIPAPLSHNAFDAVEPESEDGWDIVYTDGACKNNQGGSAAKKAGVGVWWGHGDDAILPRDAPEIKQTTVRNSLLSSAHSKLSLIRRSHSYSRPTPKYAIQSMTEWIHGWIKNGWKKSDGKPVSNAPLLRYLSALLDERAFSGQKVRLKHVRGHVGEEGNEGADALANEGCWLDSVAERDWDAFAKEVNARKGNTARAVTAASASEVVVAAVSSLSILGGAEVTQVELGPANS